MEDFVIIWEAPPIIKPEFRLYYDEQGKVLFYTCEKPEGNYVVVDAVTYAEGRPDIRIVDGKISTVAQGSVVCKLIPTENTTDEYVECSEDDVSIIITNKRFKLKKTKWKLSINELR
jgi:hypothetical protein